MGTVLLDCTDGEQRHRPLEVHIGPLFRPYLGPEPRPRVTASAALRRLRSRRRITYKKTTSLLIGNKQRSTGENRGRSGTGSGSVLTLVELGDHLVRERFHLHGHLRPLAQHVVLHMRNSTRTSGGTSLRCHVSSGDSSGDSSDVSSGASSGEGEVQAEVILQGCDGCAVSHGVEDALHHRPTLLEGSHLPRADTQMGPS